MNYITVAVGGLLTLLLFTFIIRLFYNIIANIIDGRKFHHALEQEFNKLRLSNMLSALGINKADYIYQTNVVDIQQQMKNCTDCTNTHRCDEELTNKDSDISTIEFCNNKEELDEVRRRQLIQK